MTAEAHADSDGQSIQRGRTESVSAVFMAKDTLDPQPCDVVLMVKDGKQFRAHRRSSFRGQSFL